MEAERAFIEACETRFRGGNVTSFNDLGACFMGTDVARIGALTV